MAPVASSAGLIGSLTHSSSVTCTCGGQSLDVPSKLYGSLRGEPLVGNDEASRHFDKLKQLKLVLKVGSFRSSRSHLRLWDAHSQTRRMSMITNRDVIQRKPRNSMVVSSVLECAPLVAMLPAWRLESGSWNRSGSQQYYPLDIQIFTWGDFVRSYLLTPTPDFRGKLSLIRFRSLPDRRAKKASTDLSFISRKRQKTRQVLLPLRYRVTSSRLSSRTWSMPTK